MDFSGNMRFFILFPNGYAVAVYFRVQSCLLRLVSPPFQATIPPSVDSGLRIFQELFLFMFHRL